MNIQTQKNGSSYELQLEGRLDASWCGHLESVFEETIRQGEHHLCLDMAEVHYLSSAGIRLLLKTFKRLKAIDGSFQITRISDGARTVLEMAGLGILLSTDEPQPDATSVVPQVTTHQSNNAAFDIHVPTASIPAINLRPLGTPEAIGQGAHNQFHEFQAPSFLIGVGAIGRDHANNENRMGELLAVAGHVVYQPTDGAKQPDFMVSSGQLKAEGQVMLGLAADTLPTGLARFEAKGATGVIALSELAATVLTLTQSSAAIIVALTETSGLIGATLQRSPAPAGTSNERFQLPGIREWLSFSPDRIHRDTTSLVAGVVARPGTKLDPWLRPMNTEGNLMGHFHAACFPYHPLRKGNIELASSITNGFENEHLLAVLHLLADTREFIGAGESEFYRGACWYAPVNL